MTDENTPSPRKRKRKGPLMASLGVRMRPELKVILEQLALAYDLDLSEIVRVALAGYVANVIMLTVAELGSVFKAGMEMRLTARGYRPFQLIDENWVEVELAPELEARMPRPTAATAWHPEPWPSAQRSEENDRAT